MTYLAAALILAAFGLVLLIGEYFFATHGILLVGAILLFLAAVGIIGIYGSMLELVIASLAGVIAIPLGTYGAVLAWKRLFGGDPSPAAEASIAEMPELQSEVALRGRIGKAVSLLRPSGVVDFDGRRVDCITEGLMVAAGAWVKCIDVKPGRVIVREVEVEETPAPKPAPPTPAASDNDFPQPPPAPRGPLDLNKDDWQIQ